LVRRGLYILFTVVMLVAIPLYSQSVTIIDVVVSGNSRISQDLILATSGLRIGDAFQTESVSTAIKSLYKLNVFEDVNVQATDLSTGVRLTINVIELPVISRLDYNGNKALSDSKIEELSAVKVGSYWSGVLQAENTKRLLTEYKAKGYNTAAINYRERITDEGIDLRIDVVEGRKIVVRRINFFGNKQLDNKQLLKQMKTKQKSLFRSGTFDQEKYQEDLKSIVDYYQKEGFIDARVVRFDDSMEEDRFLILNIYLEEGIQYFFGSVSISGNSHFDTSAILAKFTLIENEVFNMENFNKQLANVSSMYYEEGYLYYRSDPQIRKDGNIVNIHVEITENTRAKIHKVHITGNTRTKEKIIRRQLSVAPGDYFRYSRVIRSQQNVYNLGFFEPDLGIDYIPINNDGDVDLYLSVTDRSSGTINGGIGYNSRDSVVGNFGISHNNLFGNYWQTSLAWEFSKVSNNIDLSFTNPYLYDTDLLFGFNLYHVTRYWNAQNYKINNDGGLISLGYPIKLLDYTQITGAYSFYYKQYQILNQNRPSTETMIRLDAEGRKNTRSFSLTLSRNSQDNVFFPTSGSRLVVRGEIAGGPLGGDFDFYKQTTEAIWFTPLFWEAVLRTKMRVGFVDKYGGRGKVVPPDERFYLGGTGFDGIRGYGEREIFPIDRKNNEYGGLRSVLFSTEIGVPIASDQFVGLLFLDSGNSYFKFSDVDVKDFYTGTGAGVRIRTPMGLIGFDYAYSFKSDKWMPHFQFGTNF